MKKTISLATAIIFILLSARVVFAQNFTLFKPLSISGYSVRMPEGTALPDRSKLRLAETRVNPMDSRVIMFLYRHLEKMYIDEHGEFIYPYMEMTMETEDKTVHILKVSFINNALEIELYENKAAFGDSHQDELMRIEHFKQRKIREFNAKEERQ